MRNVGKNVCIYKPVDMNKPALKKLVIAMSEYERIYGEFPPEHLATILAMELLNSNIEIQKIKEEQKYDFILLDRWIYSHIAFANTYGIDQSIINEIFKQCLIPNQVFLCDAPIDIIMERIRARKVLGLNENVSVLIKTQEFFREIASNHNFKVIDTYVNNIENTQDIMLSSLLMRG